MAGGMAENTAQRLKDEIENEIVAGRLGPGDRLDETSLAARYGVSRTPIREALLQLAGSGLIEMRPHRGAAVAAVGPMQLVEMFEVMAELEAMSGRLATRRMSDSDLQALSAIHGACRGAVAGGDTDAYYYENERFHLAIYDASGNGFLAEQAKALHRRLQPYRRLQLRVRDRMATSFREHDAVMAALSAGDAEAAADALRSHVSVQGQRFADLMASMPSLRHAGG